MIFTRSFLCDQFTPIALYGRIKELYPTEITQFFESGVNTIDGNFSYIIVGARERLEHRDGTTYYTNDRGIKEEVDPNPLLFLKRYYSQIDAEAYQKVAEESGVGFVDGFIGYIGYDMVKVFEPILAISMKDLRDPAGIPDFLMVRPRLILCYSHKKSRVTLVTSLKEVASSFDDLEKALQKPIASMPLKAPVFYDEGRFEFDRDAFFARIDAAKEMIKSGDVFQILISNRYLRHASVDPLSFYRIIRTKNPSPYMFLLEFEGFAIAGSSPEVMVRLDREQVLLRPIAGTRKRGKNRVRDLELEEEMLADPKERAEHIMLVDLGRNDVGRIAKTGTVKVEALMHVERYSHVMHIVSDVVAEIDESKDMFDLLMATFPAGTMTGAPKIRAMQLIAEFEGMKRGFYSGTIGYFGFDGNMDSTITIRTALIKPDLFIAHAGAGVVADSIPELEELEVRNKSAAVISSLEELATLA
ncbi:MAG: anthranilate synthase component I family protein [Campylobacterales bacterium]